MMPFYWYVLCIGTLLCWHAYDVMFMGCDSHFGTQKNYATTTLRSKTRRRATPLLPTWICSCQSVGTVNFALPFTTDVTISISILQTFRSWVATSHLRPPMAFLSHSSSDAPGLARLMNVLFWGRCDFPVSFSGRDMSRNVWNRL